MRVEGGDRAEGGREGGVQRRQDEAGLRAKAGVRVVSGHPKMKTENGQNLAGCERSLRFGSREDSCEDSYLRDG